MAGSASRDLAGVVSTRPGVPRARPGWSDDRGGAQHHGHGNENAEIVRRGFEAFNAADVGALTRLFAADSSWNAPGRSTRAGGARGREAIFGRSDDHPAADADTPMKWSRATGAPVVPSSWRTTVRLLHRFEGRGPPGHLGARVLLRPPQLGRVLVVARAGSQPAGRGHLALRGHAAAGALHWSAARPRSRQVFRSSSAVPRAQRRSERWKPRVSGVDRRS